MACERRVVEALNSALDVHADGDHLEARLDGTPGATPRPRRAGGRRARLSSQGRRPRDPAGAVATSALVSRSSRRASRTRPARGGSVSVRSRSTSKAVPMP